MKRTLICALLLVFAAAISAQESKVKINHEGKDFSMLKHAWKAQWITHPSESTLDYGVFNFRKTFELKSVPEEFIVHVSADNRYRLYVNGEYIVNGPSIGDINNYRYETINISEHLVKGKNVIASEVVNFGEYRRAAQQTFQTAFILQAETGEDLDLNTGSADWKVIRNNAYQCIPFTSDSLRAYYSAGPGEFITAEIYPWDWNETDYDDSAWLKPKAGTVEFAVGKGFLYGSTWFLVPRQIPFMSETPERFSSIRRTYPETTLSSFLEENVSATIPANSKISILIDNKVHTTGFPELTISKGKNAKIKITYAESLYRPRSMVFEENSHFSKHDLKGDRNRTERKYIFGYYDKIVADGGVERSYKPFSRKTFRYIQLDIETSDEELVINDYLNIYTAYPFEENASFKSEDEQLDKIWEAAWRTLMNSSEENFFDPYYEKLQYIGVTRIEALVSLYVSGDDRLMRKAIQQFDDSRLPNGLTQSRYPSYIVQVIPPYSLLWIGMIHDYFMYSDDMSFVKSFYPGIKTVLNWFGDRVDSTGMVTGTEWWNFTDWSKGFMNGIPPGADNGYSANVTLQYAYALQGAVEIFEEFGDTKEAEEYREILETIKRSVVNMCFSEEKGMIAETPDQTIFSQHTNIWAILTSTVPESQQAELMQKILEDESLIQSTIYFRFYLFRALQKSGLGNMYLDMLGPWNNMLAKGMTTFGEKDDVPRSDCHGWSASPCFDLIHTVAGIYPAEPGFKSVVIAPNPGNLKSIEVNFPHPEGNIHLTLNIKNGNKIKGLICLPPKVEGVFIWENQKITLSSGENKIKK
ncbi:MAG: alpha-L-rhamnosidase [Bacteroidales bacterium]|nr:alpha-L-rhamnosidase [Bacteroidales bacterium]